MKGEKALKEINEKLRILILMTLGYEDNQRKQIEYFINLWLSDKEIADLLQVSKKYVSKERCIIKKEDERRLKK